MRFPYQIDASIVKSFRFYLSRVSFLVEIPIGFAKFRACRMPGCVFKRGRVWKLGFFSSRLLRSRLVFAFFSFGFWSFCEFTWRGIQLKRPLLLLLGQAISRVCIAHKRTSQTKACRRWWSSPALLLGGGGASPRAGGLIFHRLVEQHRCLYLLGLAMRHTFFRHLEWWLSFFEKDCSFFVWIEVLDRWCLACDEISWKNTIFRDWMACQSLAVIPQILRPFWWLI